jgi:hypothetical protein
MTAIEHIKREESIPNPFDSTADPETKKIESTYMTRITRNIELLSFVFRENFDLHQQTNGNLDQSLTF